MTTRSCRRHAWILVPAVLVAIAGAAAQAADETDKAKVAAEKAALEKLEKHRCKPPAEFASIFSFGWGADEMPKDDAKFDQLLQKIKAAGFNVIHTSYTPGRLALCKTRGVKLMIDLLDAENHHVFDNSRGGVDKAKALAQKLRGDPGVWGYNIWNESTPTNRRRWDKLRPDINTVRRWDPTHPAHCSSYYAHSINKGLNGLHNADILSYYDFHWNRSPYRHFELLRSYHDTAALHRYRFYTWLPVQAGKVGQENFRRNLWSVNTGVAWGLKGVGWFLGQEMMDPQTLEWRPAGRDIAEVNARIMPLRTEIAKIGNPVSVYATENTRNMWSALHPNGVKRLPRGCRSDNAFPADFRLQPDAGEFVMGVFQDDRKRDVIFVANYNAYAEQDVALKPSKPAKVSLFSRKEAKWQPLDVKNGAVRFRLAPAAAELLRLEK